MANNIPQEDVTDAIVEQGKKMGDALIFNHSERSGFLDHMNIDSQGNDRPNGNRVMYPNDLDTNAEYGQLVHFDIYYKENPSMDSIVQKVTDVAGGLADGVASIVSGVGDLVTKTLSGDSEGTAEVINDALNKLGGGAKKIENAEDNKKLIAKETRLGKANSMSKDKVTLYLPGGLTNTDTLTYQEHDMGLLKGLLDGNLSAMIPGVVSKAAGFVDSAAGLVGQETSAAPAISALMGSVRNPRKEQLFDSVEFRTFDFTFNFRPKSEKEAYDMLTICKLFRFHAHPELNASQAYLLTPSEFQITFIDLKYTNSKDTDKSKLKFNQGGLSTAPGYASENAWINKVGRCACTSVAVNYHPNDIVSTFENGVPTAIDLTLSFTEMEAITRNHIYAGF